MTVVSWVFALDLASVILDRATHAVFSSATYCLLGQHGELSSGLVHFKPPFLGLVPAA